ncbi:MAG: cell wall hydrolase [Anaerolineales bacterium]|jgi:spore germination cell wall hydrolase CwlJ-like protein|nr:cell wall hydrolase [Anaerolineales bacterium]
MEPSVSILFAVMTVLSPLLAKHGYDDAANVDGDELYCAAQNIYFESRGEPDLGQLGVGQVVLNRVESPKWPDSICDVVWQEKQFSWTHDGKSDRIKLSTKENRRVWMKSVFYAVMSLIEDDVTNEATHYHSESVEPYWTKSMTQTAHIGNHIFYKEE